MKSCFLVLFWSVVVADQFDVRETTIQAVHTALRDGGTSCREIVSASLSRIEALNPSLNAMISIDPSVLDIADNLDLALSVGNMTGELFCIPTILKDNYNFAGLPTTGASLSLSNYNPGADAPVVKAIRSAGAIILGKANLHEFALEGITASSLGGQTINPYDHTRTPGGSSGGTAVAVTASFAIWGTGSDTFNSLRSPASANNLFSVRPTRGLISRSGVMPNSFTQDALGPIARTVTDLAIALTVMARVGHDGADNSTKAIPEALRDFDFSQSLHRWPAKGMRFGFVETLVNRTAGTETSPVNDAMLKMRLELQNAGATVLNIDQAFYDSSTLVRTCDAQMFEFREGLDEYLRQNEKPGALPISSQDIFSGDEFMVLPAQYEYVRRAMVSSTSNSTYRETMSAITEVKSKLRETFASLDLDALVFPQQKNLVVKVGAHSQVGRNGILGAASGFPVVTVPVGFSPVTEEAPIGLPIGMEILGLPWTEAKLLGIAADLEKRLRLRRVPSFGRDVVETNTYDLAPIVRPNTSVAYRLGTLEI